MTNEEAISVITQIKGIITNDNSWSDLAKSAAKEAFDLAIKTLEQQLECGCNTCEYYPMKDQRPQGDLIKAFELLKAHCKNRECNSDCIFYRELRVGNNKEQFCNLCEIVTSDDKENNND